MKGYMTFPSAVRNDPEVADWFRQDESGLREIASRWFQAMKNCGDDVDELMHDGYPTACVEGVAFGYVGAFKRHVNVGFFLGAELPDSRRLLEGTGKRMRHVKIRPGAEPDSVALEALIAAAYRDIKARIGAG